MDLVTIQWLAGLAAILAAGVVLGRVVYVVGGWLIDMLDDSIEHGNDE